MPLLRCPPRSRVCALRLSANGATLAFSGENCLFPSASLWVCALGVVRDLFVALRFALLIKAVRTYTVPGFGARHCALRFLWLRFARVFAALRFLRYGCAPLPLLPLASLCANRYRSFLPFACQTARPRYSHNIRVSTLDWSNYKKGALFLSRPLH